MGQSVDIIDNKVIEKAFFSLIRFEINETEISSAVKNSITLETLPHLYKLSKLHDLAHLVCDSLDKNGLLDLNQDIKTRFIKERNLAMFRYEQINFEYNKILEIFNQTKIYLTPLKGSIIRELYPVPWLRTSSDIDILIDKSSLESIEQILTKNHGWIFKKEMDNTYSVYTTTGVHVELHTDLTRDFKNGELITNLNDYLTENAYIKFMGKEAFYVHVLAHMAKHVIHGGCGVRAFLDVWLINKNWQFDAKKLNELLENSNLLTFEKAVRKLSEIWLEDQPYDELSLKLSEFILHGGVYGNIENQVAVNKAKSNGKSSGLFKKIFLPYNQLKITYPIIVKHKWLTPFFEVIRWFRIVFKGKSKILAKELKANKKITKTETENTAKLLKELGL